MESAIIARLAEHLGTAYLIGDRVYPLQAPQNPVYPFVVYERTNTDSVTSLNSDSGLLAGWFDISCFAKSYLGAKYLAAQIMSALKRYRGTTPIVVDDIFLRGESDGYDPDLDLYYVTITFECLYRS